jgi:hypothetical protein
MNFLPAIRRQDEQLDGDWLEARFKQNGVFAGAGFGDGQQRPAVGDNQPLSPWQEAPGPTLLACRNGKATMGLGLPLCPRRSTGPVMTRVGRPVPLPGDHGTSWSPTRNRLASWAEEPAPPSGGG